MSNSPILSRISIYPVKSLDGLDLEKAKITKGGCLSGDREFAIFDAQGNFINGKANPLVHTLRSKVDFEEGTISFLQADKSTWLAFHFAEEKTAIEAFLSDHFGQKAFWIQNKTGRFLDIPDLSGVSVVSTSSLENVNSWFENQGLDETRKRFRTTLEIDGVEAFWEDHLFASEGKSIEFKIGEVTLFGMSPRARCVVPTRHTETGEVTHAFPKIFAKNRAASLPPWSKMAEYGHYYHLAVDCYIPETQLGKTIETGSELKIVGERSLEEIGWKEV